VQWGAPVPVDVKLPPDLIFETTVGADQAVTFRHTTHVEFANGRCVACHPAPFRMLRPTRKASHAADSCGSCHDGTKAIGTDDQDACSTCHAGRGPAGGATP
jgi:c(7)-type cytochrome triheme protein